MFKEYVSKLPMQFADFLPAPKQNERTTWEALSSDIKNALAAEGKAAEESAWHTISAGDYLAFSRTGNREAFEAKYFSRRKKLNALTLAECVNPNTHIESIIDGITLLCSEPAWQLPAHNTYIRDTPQLPYPDTGRPIIDLFAAETGAQLAVTRYVLKEALDAVSPEICHYIERTLKERIIEPYLTSHFWWMGSGDKIGDEPMCNWTPWCTQNVLLVFFSLPLSTEIRRKACAQAAFSLDCFLKDYAEDGGCTEGVQYYRHAGLCLFNAMHILNAVSGGTFEPLYTQSKIRNIASFPLYMHADDEYYFNFADCSPKAGRAGVREFLFGKATKDDELVTFAASEYRKSPLSTRLLQDELNLFYRLQSLFAAEEIAKEAENTVHPEKSAPIHAEKFYTGCGIFITGDETFRLAVKAGNNADSHNHNDVGSFIIYRNGRPLFIDVGVETYTKKTFSPERYDIWTMQSAYHNVPTFGTIMQKDGAAYCARSVSYQFAEKSSSVSMDIASAYPAESGIKTYTRKITLEKGTSITICDECTPHNACAVLSLMVCAKPHFVDSPNADSAVRFLLDDSTVTITGLSAPKCATEPLHITDARLRQVWDETIYRILVPFTEKLTIVIS